ncbi:MAG: thioredoxin family protein [FCB group bacterium]|nr:thioredoxin family protein [FCB group bacterium]
MKNLNRKLPLIAVFVAMVVIIISKNANNDKSAAVESEVTQTTEAVVSSDGQSHEAAEVTPANLPRMLELGSVGCAACAKMEPVLEEVRAEYEGRLSVEFFDVRKDNKPAKKYRIRLIPTQIFLDAEGNEYFRHEGFFSKEDIDKVLADMGVVK